MGVAGLWDVIKPAGTVRSLIHIAVQDGFEANPDRKRGFRLGIDASIWFFHAEYGREGENPVLRTLFFRCATLMHTTFLPLFVFDGPKRPDVKRGKRINRTSHKLIPGMKKIVEAFGFEWRMAPGEAEAELAYLNRIGIIDGILSDDVDNFLFGAQTVIRNSSNTLSGNRSNPILNSVGKDDKIHSRIFNIATITNHPDIRLTRGGMILIGLMSGGDYQQGGLTRCGITTAHALARCGFGDSLFEAAMSLDRDSLEDFLVSWREGVCNELRTNSKGEIGRKQVALANSITTNFPDIEILFSYVKPITSESMGRTSDNLRINWEKEPDLAKLASVCEFYFEWGYKEAIVKRFRTVMWHSIVLRILRRAVLDLDHSTPRPEVHTTPKKRIARDTPCGTPSKMITKHFSSLDLNSHAKVYISGSESNEKDEEQQLIVKVHARREHPSTDGLPEYRLEIAPKQLVQLTESGVKGLRTPEGPDEWASEEIDKVKRGKKVPIDPETHLRVWMPACMVKLVEPQLIDDFEGREEKKRLKKATTGTRNASSKGKRQLDPVIIGQKQTQPKLLLEGDSDEYESFLRRRQDNNETRGSPAASTKHAVNDISLAPVRSRPAIRDLTKKKTQIPTAITQRDRKASPSPSKRLAKKPINIIEISSESDSSDQENTIPLLPLLRARARATRGINPPETRNEDKRISSDVIDLT